MTRVPSRSARLILGGVTVYQQLRAHRPSPCRFIPTCSEYARDAVTEHGAGRGTWLAVRRLSRCHPLGGHGFDPVPERTRAQTVRAHAEVGGHSC